MNGDQTQSSSAQPGRRKGAKNYDENHSQSNLDDSLIYILRLLRMRMATEWLLVRVVLDEILLLLEKLRMKTGKAVQLSLC